LFIRKEVDDIERTFGETVGESDEVGGRGKDEKLE